MDVKEQLKSKSLSELFMLIRNAHGATALAASEEIERRLSAQHNVQRTCFYCDENKEPAKEMICQDCVDLLSDASR